MSDRIRAIIIDDEDKSRHIIKALLSSLRVNIDIIDEGKGVKDGILKINAHLPDLLFLDIQLTDGNAFDLLEQIPDYEGHIIFITAYDQFALQAFEYAALDYLMKPIALNQLKRAVSRVGTIQNQRKKLNTLLANNHVPAQENKIIVENKNGIEILDMGSVSFCEADGNYTKIHKTDGTSFLSSKTLAHFENILPKQFFFRIHHKFLINTTQIQKFKKGPNSMVIMTKGLTLEVSRRRKMDFITFLTNL